MTINSRLGTITTEELKDGNASWHSDYYKECTHKANMDRSKRMYEKKEVNYHLLPLARKMKTEATQQGHITPSVTEVEIDYTRLQLNQQELASKELLIY